jgi:Uma2 family endonuclease
MTVTATQPKVLTLAEFLDWKPENGSYELHDGVIVEMQPKGKHEEVIGFLSLELAFLVRDRHLPYFFSKQALVKSPDKDTAYLPDVLVINRHALVNEPLWEKSSTLTLGTSIPLAIEVVSTNWRDDYLTKLRDYEEIGIPEYWIVDYLALGGSRYIGSPKQPTISIYQLIDGEYQVRQFRENDQIESATFPELTLTAIQVFQGKQEIDF